jgi:hypothetical protein
MTALAAMLAERELQSYPARERNRVPAIILVAGGPCSGKDLAIGILRKAGVLSPSDYFLLSGALFHSLAEYQTAPFTHPELLPSLKPEYRHATLLLSEEVLRRGYDVVLNTHLDDITAIDELLRLVYAVGGYSVALAPTTPLETFALYREKQEKASLRRVDLELALDLHRQFSANWRELVRQVDAHALLDNSLEQIDAQGVPRLCAFGTRSDGTTVLLPGPYMRFLAKAEGRTPASGVERDYSRRIFSEAAAAAHLHALTESLCSETARNVLLAVR